MLAQPDTPLLSITMQAGLEVKVWDNLNACQTDWLRLEGNALGPAFQRFGWQKAWFDALGKDAGDACPFIIMGYLNEAAAFVLPFARMAQNGISRLVWAGGKHSNFNFGLFSSDMQQMLEDPSLCNQLQAQILNLLRQSGVDLVHLQASPNRWDGQDHLFAQLATQKGMTPAYGVDLTAGFDSLFGSSTRKRMRKKHRWQRRFLEQEGHTWRLVHSSKREELAPFLDAFYAQKQARFQTMGIEDIFSRSDVQAFIDGLAAQNMPDREANAVLHFYGLEVDGRLIATYAGGSQNGCFSAYFNSFDEDFLPRLSAGEMLLGEMIHHRCELGDRFFDLGMGEERYKHLWCDQRIDYGILTLPLTGKGKAIALLQEQTDRLRRLIRSNERLWGWYKALRKAKAFFS